MNYRWLAVIIPVLGLLVLIGRAEYAVRSGESWLIPITGYDPRDLLHGHFLRYQFQFNWQGIDTCGSSFERSLDASCCLCLNRNNERGFDPPVSQMDCEQAQETCDGWLHSASVMPPLRYFVPEEQALNLEQQLQTKPAWLQLTCGPEGTPAISELYLDGHPWREVLANASQNQ